MSKKIRKNSKLTLDNIYSCLDVLSRANALAAAEDKKLSDDIAKVIYTIMVACQLNDAPANDQLESLTDYSPKKKSQPVTTGCNQPKNNEGKYYYYARNGQQITDLLTGEVICRP